MSQVIRRAKSAESFFNKTHEKYSLNKILRNSTPPINFRLIQPVDTKTRFQPSKFNRVLTNKTKFTDKNYVSLSFELFTKTEVEQGYQANTQY